MGEEHARCIPTALEIEVLQYIASGHSRWLALANCALVCKTWTVLRYRMDGWMDIEAGLRGLGLKFR